MADNFQNKNNNGGKKDFSSGADRLITRALHALQKEYVLVGKTHVRAWHAWLGVGALAGLLIGVVLVANRSGEFQPSEASIALYPPANLVASAVSPSQINLSWTDTNTREQGYSVERSLSATSGFAEIFRTGANATSYGDQNLSLGTAYYYRIRAFKGLTYSIYSNIASATTLAPSPSDTTPPSVSITSPASGVTVSGTITIVASASDNVGVAGVQFKLDGSNLGAEDTSSPYSVSWNTTTATNTSHTLTAVARDAAGNMTTSSAVSVTVNNSTTDFYVAPGGSDTNSGSATSPWKTITHAGSVVTPGSTVHVASGTYQEAVTTNANGTVSARIRYVSDVKWGAKIAPAGAYTAWQNNGSYITIEGFEVVGDSSTNLGMNNTGSYTKIIGNHVHNIPLPNCGGTSGNGGAAIDDSNYSASDDDIIGNLVHDVGQILPDGLAAASYCNSAQGVYQANLRGYVENNIVYRVAAYGIHLWHAANNVVVSNNLSFNNGATTNLGNFIGGGMVVGAGDSPGGVTDDNTTVSNNIVRNNRGVAIVEEGYTGSGNRYFNNIIFQNAYNKIIVSTGTQSGTLFVDPLMVNFQINGGGDYHSQSGSPAIDAGTTVCAPNTPVCVPVTDFGGKVRPNGAGYDIGAYEY